MEDERPARQIVAAGVTRQTLKDVNLGSETSLDGNSKLTRLTEIKETNRSNCIMLMKMDIDIQQPMVSDKTLGKLDEFKYLGAIINSKHKIKKLKKRITQKELTSL